MIWLTWRQHRKQALFAAIGLIALAVVMLPTGLSMHHDFVHSGLAACVAKLGTGQLIQNSGVDDCQSLSSRFESQYGGMSLIAILLVVLPLLVGLFFGAPLVAREVEQGTHRFVWTQQVSRLRWSLVKFGLVGAVTLLLATAYALGASWWAGPLDQAGDGRFGNLVFDLQGIAPIGYTVFAVALGIFAGTVWRRTVPAMAVTLVGFLGVRILIEALARPRFTSPQTLTYSVVSSAVPNPASGDWVYARGVRDAAGKLVAPNSEIQCAPGGGAPPAGGGGSLSPAQVSPDGGCGSQLGLGPGSYNWEQYQPGNRFWEFQGIETGIFFALAAVLVFFAIRRLRRIS